MVATAAGAVGSKIQSAAGAAETAVEALIPRNCSLGTRQFCVGFSNHTNCADLPLNISDIIPEAVTSFIGDGAQSLQPLEGIMAKVAPSIIQGSFAFGLGFLVIMAALFVITIFRLLSITTFFLRLGVCLVAVLSFIPFVIPTAILYQVQSDIRGLESIVGIKKGDVASKCTGVVFCAGVMMLLTIFMTVFG